MRLFFLSFILITSTWCSAQQDPLTGMFWNNYAHFNPATSGMVCGHELNATYRNQWTGVNGAPVEIFGNYNTILFDKHGVGVNYRYDAIGFTRSHLGNINYNYQFKFENASKLAIGAAAGIQSLQMNANWVPPTTVDDPTLPGTINQTSLNVNAGVAYLGKYIYTGIGATNLVPSVSGQTIHSSPTMHAHFRYRLPVSRQAQLYFAAAGRTDFVFTSFDLSVRYVYLKKLWFGLSYRNRESIGANITWDIKQRYRIGYMYEHSFSKLSNVSRGSHEIVLGLRIF